MAIYPNVAHSSTLRYMRLRMSPRFPIQKKCLPRWFPILVPESATGVLRARPRIYKEGQAEGNQGEPPPWVCVAAFGRPTGLVRVGGCLL